MTNVHRPQEKSGHSAVTEEFSRLHAFLKRFLSRFFSRPQDIDDVLQDTFLSAYRAEQEQVIVTPKAFLFRVARNAALKELERRSRQLTDYIEDYSGNEISSDADVVENQAAARQKLGLFCDSVLEMSPQVRRVFLMRKVYGLSQKEIAAQLGIAVSTVEKHIARGLEICTAYVEAAERDGRAVASETDSQAVVIKPKWQKNM